MARKTMVMVPLLVCGVLNFTTLTQAWGDIDLARVFLNPANLQPSPLQISREQALEDFEYSQYFLKYAFPKYDPQNLAWDFAFNAVHDKIQSQATWEPKDLLNVLGDLLLVAVDHHANLMMLKPDGDVLLATTPGRWQPYVLERGESAPPLGQCEVPTPSQFLPNQTFLIQGVATRAEVILSPLDLKSVVCRTATGSETYLLHALRTSKPALPDFDEKRIDAKTYYIRLGTFLMDDALMTKWLNSAKNVGPTDHLILDLRGNGGGYDQVYADWLKVLGLGDQSLVNPKVSYLNSTAANTLILNSDRFYLNELQQTGGDPQMMKDIQAQITQMLPEVESRNASHQIYDRTIQETPYSRQSVDLGEARFHGLVSVLVDENCASSCEWAAWFGRQLGNFEVVGVNTSGTNVGGSPAPVVLPNSRLFQVVSTWSVEFPDGAGNDELGILPTVWSEGDLLQQLK